MFQPIHRSYKIVTALRPGLVQGRALKQWCTKQSFLRNRYGGKLLQNRIIESPCVHTFCNFLQFLLLLLLLLLIMYKKTANNLFNVV